VDKLEFLVVIMGLEAYAVLILSLALKSEKRPIPENVADLWTPDRLKEQRACFRESLLFLLKSVIGFSFVYSLEIILDVPETWSSLFVGVPVLWLLAGELMMVLHLEAIVLCVKHYMRIQERHGVGKSTWKSVRKKCYACCGCMAILSFLDFLSVLLLPAEYLSFCRSLRIMPTPPMIIVAVILLLLPLVALFCITKPLPQNPLADQVQRIISRSGLRHCTVRVRAIRNNDKKNGVCFRFFGRSVIFLFYDPDHEQDEEQILAIVAHEIGHCVHAHSSERIALLFFAFLPVILLSGFSVWPGLAVNAFVGPVFTLLFWFVWLPALIVAGLSFSRRNEYEADAYAAESGFGTPLIRMLRVSATAEYEPLNPHPLLVKMIFKHPPVSQRIEAIEKKMDRY